MRLNGVLKADNLTAQSVERDLKSWNIQLETIIDDYRNQMADLVAEIEQMKAMNVALKADLTAERDQRDLLTVQHNIVSDTGNNYKKRIMQDRIFMDEMLDLKDGDYKSLRVSYRITLERL